MSCESSPEILIDSFEHLPRGKMVVLLTGKHDACCCICSEDYRSPPFDRLPYTPYTDLIQAQCVANAWCRCHEPWRGVKQPSF